MRYALSTVTAPTDYPVTLEEARNHLRVDGTDEDAMITAQIIAATNLVEAFTNRQLCTATYDLKLDGFPWLIRIPKPPLQSVTSISYLDTASTTQTLASTVYTVDASSEPGRINPTFGQIWPVTYIQLNAVTIRFVCGYSLPGKIPEALKAAIKLLVGDMYQNRETTIDKPVNEMPTIKALLMAHLVEWQDGPDAYPTGYSWKQEWFS